MICWRFVGRSIDHVCGDRQTIAAQWASVRAARAREEALRGAADRAGVDIRTHKP